MAATLSAYIPNAQITELHTGVAGIGFVDTTSYLTRLILQAVSPPLATLQIGPGFIIGQLKKIKLVEKGLAMTAVLESTNFLAGPTQTITFSIVGDVAELMWTRNGWRIISTSNEVGNDATPVVS